MDSIAHAMQWVAEGSPTHSTPVRIDDALQFVPPNTNPKEFKRVQQQVCNITGKF